VKQEQLPWLADNPFYTKRFAFYVGRRCRSSAIRDVARELHLDWKTVKTLEMEYMREQLRRAGTPAPSVIGIDEIAIRKGHTYRIVVSDLLRGRPIWFGGHDRSEQSMDLFFSWLGPRNAAKSASRSWICGRRFATRRSSRAMRRRPASSMTSFMCCGT
jgi:transposase